MNKYEIETKNGLIETTKKGILSIDSCAYYSGSLIDALSGIQNLIFMIQEVRRK